MTLTELRDLYNLAWAAGQAILPFYRGEYKTQIKEDSSPLTEADLAANEVILAGLNSRPVLSEETAASIDYWSDHFLVDPLDGTKEFIKGHGDFTVNIALVSAGVPVAGVVVAPALEQGWAASDSVGAMSIGGPWLAETSPLPISPSPSSLERSWQGLRVAVSRSHLDAQTEALLERLRQCTEIEVLPMGSSLKIVKVATGEADLYVRTGPTSKWDIAAGHAIARATGAQVVELPSGNPLRYDRGEVLNPPFAVLQSQTLDRFPDLLKILGSKV